MGETSLAWAAGFIDGEGCIAAPVRLRDRNRRDYGLALYVGQVDPAPLHVLAGLFGGNVTPRKTAAGRRLIYMWRINGSKAEAALRRLLPHLIVKRRQAEIALELRDLITSYVQVGRRVDDEQTGARLALVAALKADKWRDHTEGGDARHA